MAYRRIDWSPRNFNKIPQKILKALEGIDEEIISVSVSKLIKPSEIGARYGHVNFPENLGEVATTLPPLDMGKWSERNRTGWEYPRRDLPKITKTRTFETPNFGDAATYGTHTHYLDQEVYPREHHEPRMYQIETEKLKEGTGDDAVSVYRVAIDAPIDRASDSFELDLLWALNILQENVGAVGVFPSDATRADYLNTVQLDWQFFPPGTRDEVIAFFTGNGGGAGQVGHTVAARVALFEKLQPTRYLKGTGGMNSYVGAQFANDLVVFENVRYGNALYVLYDDWQEVSQRSRLALLKGTDESFDRFAHTEGWEGRFLELLKTKKEERGI
ncbi:MAG: hypothetical protein AAGF53_18860 [Pseudomonadota bacterium]